MRSLFDFFYRNINIFTFFLLEIISIFLIFSNNHFQASQLVSSMYEFSNYFYHRKTVLENYFYLRQENNALLEENAKLLQLLKESKFELDNTVTVVKDTVVKQRFLYTPARVINNTISFKNNYVTINKGSKDGIKEHMGIISDKGIVGITKNVAKNTSVAVSVLHSDFRVNAKIKELNKIGSVVWYGNIPEIVIMRDIPIHAKVKKGQHVVTGPYSKIFPENVQIGTIENFEIQEGKNSYEIYVRLSVDIYNIKNVYVVTNLYKKEQEELETREWSE